MRKRGLFGLVVTFIHDLIAPFDPEEDEWRAGRKSSRFPRYGSVQRAEESARPSPSELKQMYALAHEWDGLDEETWQKIYSGELPAEDYMSTVHAFPPPQDRFTGTEERVLGPNASPNDYAEKEFPPEDFRTGAEPTPMSSEKIVIVSEDVVESVLVTKEEHSGESDPVADGESPEATTDGNSEDSFENADNSSDSQGFTEISVPNDFSSNYGWANDNAFNDF